MLAGCTIFGHIYRQTGKPVGCLAPHPPALAGEGTGHSIHCFPARVKIMAGETEKIKLEIEGDIYGSENSGARLRAQSG